VFTDNALYDLQDYTIILTVTVDLSGLTAEDEFVISIKDACRDATYTASIVDQADTFVDVWSQATITATDAFVTDAICTQEPTYSLL
jgi:hypothetical protein